MDFRLALAAPAFLFKWIEGVVPYRRFRWTSFGSIADISERIGLSLTRQPILLAIIGVFSAAWLRLLATDDRNGVTPRVVQRHFEQSVREVRRWPTQTTSETRQGGAVMRRVHDASSDVDRCGEHSFVV